MTDLIIQTALTLGFLALCFFVAWLIHLFWSVMRDWNKPLEGETERKLICGRKHKELHFYCTLEQGHIGTHRAGRPWNEALEFTDSESE